VTSKSKSSTDDYYKYYFIQPSDNNSNKVPPPFIRRIVAFATADENTVKVGHFINGAKGDESFFDSAVRGIAEVEADFGI